MKNKEPQGSAPMAAYAFRAPVTLKQRLRTAAVRETLKRKKDMTPSDVMRQAVEQYLDRSERLAAVRMNKERATSKKTNGKTGSKKGQGR